MNLSDVFFLFVAAGVIGMIIKLITLGIQALVIMTSSIAGAVIGIIFIALIVYILPWMSSFGESIFVNAVNAMSI